MDAALANHLIMGPAILARAGLRFAAKIHGSALEYTVKPHAKRFLPYAREGLDAASGVLVGSAHTAASLWRALDDPTLPAKTRLGPPGVDTRCSRPFPALSTSPGCGHSPPTCVPLRAATRTGIATPRRPPGRSTSLRTPTARASSSSAS